MAVRRSTRLSYNTPAPQYQGTRVIASSQQSQPTLSAGSPDSPSDGFQQRLNLRKKGRRDLASSPIDTVIPPVMNSDQPQNHGGEALSLPEVEELKRRLLKLKIEAEVMQEKVHLDSLAPNFSTLHKEYLSHLQGMVLECDNKIGRAKMLREDTISALLRGIRSVTVCFLTFLPRFSCKITGDKPAKKACVSEAGSDAEPESDKGSISTMERSLLEEEPSKYGEEDDQSMETEPINKEGDQSMQTDPDSRGKAASSSGACTSPNDYSMEKEPIKGADYLSNKTASTSIDKEPHHYRSLSPLDLDRLIRGGDDLPMLGQTPNPGDTSKPEKNMEKTPNSIEPDNKKEVDYPPMETDPQSINKIPLFSRSLTPLSDSTHNTSANISTLLKTTSLIDTSKDKNFVDPAADEEYHAHTSQGKILEDPAADEEDTGDQEHQALQEILEDQAEVDNANRSQDKILEDPTVDEEDTPDKEPKAPPEIRIAAKKLRYNQRQVRKNNQAKKMKVAPSALDEYDLYANPILMKDESRKRRSSLEESIHEQIDGNTRMEFGYYTKDMLKLTLVQLQLTHRLSQHSNPQGKDDPYILFVESDHWREIQGVTADKQRFRQLLLESPRLLQISATHPYFNSKIFNMDVLTKSIDANLGGELRSGSWFALNQLMCRSTDSWPYHNFNFKEYSRISLNRLMQITQDAVRSLHQLVMLPPLPQALDTKNQETDGSRAALNFLLARLSGLGAGLQPTEPPPNSDGIKSIITKIYELLLGIVLIYEGFQSKSDEIEIDSLYLPVLQKNGKDQTESTDNQPFDNSFKIGAADEWRLMKQRCIGVVALFLLFGVQGWFGCFKNRKKYTYRDIYSIFTLALDMSSRGITILSPQTEPGLHTPWRHLNGFLADLFRTTRIGCPDLNWYTAMYIWGSVLEESTISYFFLLDVFEEMKDPGKSLSSTGSEAPPVKATNEEWSKSWNELLQLALIQKSAYQTLRQQLALSKGFQPQTVVPALPSQQFEGVDLWSFMQTQCCNTDDQSEKKAKEELVDSGAKMQKK
ncbi:Golgi to ER traffic- protein [Puccinia graminis f. sp. tritici]|uniref:Golgi to ER traffic-protein n=1 Tax=Puccinia graminis f. sp. tritici TaxID=56615 RepID=A0A5B0NNV4_PUCGR|nr:Golgi to ER traffic- protein [Puccinia graminis f. sp. tritici]